MANKVLHRLTALKKGNGTYLIIFFLLFILAIGIALGIRGLNLYQSSQFITNSFTVLITAEEPYIIRLDSRQDTLSILHIKDALLDTQHLTKASIDAAVPIQASITLVDGEIENIDQVLSVGAILRQIAQGKVQLTGMNEFDVVKFMYLAKKVPHENISRKEIEDYIANTAVLGQIEEDLYELFRDPTVINERISIEVVNATQISGLATTVSHMLENGGYNVVAIRSEDTQKSVIQSSLSDSVTLTQLKQTFPFPIAARSENAVSDIKIVIGTDVLTE